MDWIDRMNIHTQTAPEPEPTFSTSELRKEFEGRKSAIEQQIETLNQAIKRKEAIVRDLRYQHNALLMALQELPVPERPVRQL